MKSRVVAAATRVMVAMSAVAAVTGHAVPAYGASVYATPAYQAPAYQPYADDVRSAQWHLEALRVDDAHRHSRGDGVTVAVLDSGVDASHPDLRDNVVPGTVVPSVDVTGRGDDGRDDPAGSGTALAGLIAGHGHVPHQPADDQPADDQPGDGPAAGRGAGVLGIAPAATVLPVVVAGPGAAPDAAALTAGLEEAVRHGADVICVGRPVPDDPAVTHALGAAAAAGVVVVVPGFPAGDALARYGGVSLLGAVPVDTAGSLAADPGPGSPGIVAVPAAGVMSTGGQGGYYRFARTAGAAATAVLAGAAALVLAVTWDGAGEDGTEPGTGRRDAARQAVHRLVRTADDGGLDLVAALTAEVGPPPSAPPGPPHEPPGDAPAAPAPDGTAGPESPERVAAFDSDDWRRWLVAAPLVVFVGLLAGFSLRAARRARR